jgi:hypothetical protein
MATRSFDVLVAKDFEIELEGKKERRTSWNRIGRAWPTKNPESISFELFIFPGQKYVLQMGEKRNPFRTPFETFEQIGGENE